MNIPQLAINDEIFVQPSVKNILQKSRGVVTYANSSNKFYPDFWNNQQDIMKIWDRKCLKSDTDTR